MQFGIGLFATQKDVDAVTLARAVEERGFESLWLPDIITIDATAYRDTNAEFREAFPDHEWLWRPKGFWQAHDPFVALTAAAVVTSRLHLAAIAHIAERDPIVTAKMIATVDRIAAGRFLLAVQGYRPPAQSVWGDR
jgi:alkanesulfonate monooxygenase SsuD/methylene tetrahydromethanopterin reductase-like flavin-dependent oxidoreductase (luciferase family)